MKILDRYIIKTFFGPFLFIFSVLFFIFVVNIIWIQMAQFMGKGLSVFQIAKLLFYMGATVVQMVLPLTVLLSSIMTFGEFGERYELAAMKAAGISLTRIMAPLFLVVSLMAVVLFFFQNNISPDFQRKARNMMYNIAISKPALNFVPGQFISQIPGYSVKFDEISGENGENVSGVFIHKATNIYEDQQAVIARKGKFVPAADKNYLKLELHDGYAYEGNYRNRNYLERLKQPNQSMKFDTLVLHFDVSELINKAIEKEQITDDYRFQSYAEIESTIGKRKKENTEVFNGLGISLVSSANNYISMIEASKAKSPKTKPQFKIDTLKKDKKMEVLYASYHQIENQKNELAVKLDQINGITKGQNKMIMYQQRILAYSFTCIIFFLIGASLGSIIRKGGIGTPVVIAIIIFIIFYVLNLTVENLSWKGKMDPYLASWLPNLLLFPFGVWLTFKALADSQLFDVEKYKTLLKPLWSKFVKPKEHARYR
ncbi:LptF/LptG family permease [Bergeyella sp. RCAD1439]|uniref:LptF/LptG family permease n=1 Tax=Bergeyella anatis TaxID=3113737 RepID=UPI002E1935B3|nr:LptF/LptG family permease [Bergeyella sp. RCAD1439]